MRSITNLGWPDTPFGSTGRPVQRSVQWLTGLSCQWTDTGQEPTLVGAAAVLMPVHRTRSTPVSADLAHFGFMVLMAEAVPDTGLLDALDAFLVQARRQARIISWHSAADDLQALRDLARSCDGHRHPGVTSLSEAWVDRQKPERDTAHCVDTALALGPGSVIRETAEAHALMVSDALLLPQYPTHGQKRHRVLAEGSGTALMTESIAVDALAQALITTLLGGKATGHLHWGGKTLNDDGALDIYAMIDAVAWGHFPSVFLRTLNQ
ncbi:hypothetical protein ACFVIM_17790 [Streptomyces sp. NPDC057638]|uniref:hypothetical protein n=1 Tax=Streptomyces sp. NPDC057638 TaxID=3346190 RepID=UPI00369A6595